MSQGPGGDSDPTIASGRIRHSKTGRGVPQEWPLNRDELKGQGFSWQQLTLCLGEPLPHVSEAKVKLDREG